MRTTILRQLTAVGLAIGVVVGCDSVIDHIADEATSGSDQTGTPTTTGTTSTAGFATIDSGFSDAPISPGGTGGVIDEDSEPVGEETRSFFEAFQIDPEAEDTAGPKFVISADVDQDGRLDLISAWNQSQG